LPPGDALYAHELERWSTRRRGQQTKTSSGTIVQVNNGRVAVRAWGNARYIAAKRAKRFRDIDRKFGQLPPKAPRPFR
jgi:hypothetical protein